MDELELDPVSWYRWICPNRLLTLLRYSKGETFKELPIFLTCPIYQWHSSPSSSITQPVLAPRLISYWAFRNLKFLISKMGIINTSSKDNIQKRKKINNWYCSDKVYRKTLALSNQYDCSSANQINFSLQSRGVIVKNKS